MRLYIARHGESIANVKTPNFDSPEEMNGPLTSKGRSQAKSLADWLEKNNINIDVLYASSLLRTKETAEIIAKVLKLPVIHSDLIREASYSYWDHRPIPDKLLTVSKDNDFHINPFIPFDSNVEDMESYSHLKTRVGKFVTKLIDNYKSQTVLVIGHGWVKNAFFDIIFNVGSYRRCVSWVEYTALSSFEYSENEKMYGPWSMKYINQTEHLAFAGLERSLE